MIELKDVVGWLVGCLGLAFGAYQYWRSELSKHPLVIIQSSGTRGGEGVGGTIIVRNRSPLDIHVETMRARRPAGALMVIPGPPVQAASGEMGKGANERVLVRRLDMRLKAYADGEFPSASHWFGVMLPEGSAPKFVELEIVIAESRSAKSSSRCVVRKRIQIAKSKPAP